MWLLLLLLLLWLPLRAGSDLVAAVVTATLMGRARLFVASPSGFFGGMGSLAEECMAGRVSRLAIGMWCGHQTGVLSGMCGGKNDAGVVGQRVECLSLSV